MHDGRYPISFSTAAPDYSDAGAMAKALMRLAPDRLVWGTDWPHPTERERKPDDAHLYDLFVSWAETPTLRDKILVTNPQTLYGFGKP